MRILEWKKLSPAEQVQALRRPSFAGDAAITATVATIIANVRDQGDAALRDYALTFDKSDLKNLRVSEAAIDAAAQQLDVSLAVAIRQAIKNVEAHHALQIPSATRIETMPGVVCEKFWRPIDCVGLYIPGGTAPLFSTLLMQAVPAKIAGCARIVLCTPAREGKINPAILATAKFCGVTEIYAVGGSQAIAAMAYGTQTIPKADKIFGPGNAYVTAAKQLVAQDADGATIDMPAGPSEVMVIAENSARADWVAADLLAQAEHDTNAQALLVTTDATFAARVQQEIETQLTTLPRAAIARESLKESRALIVPDIETALNVSNRYAPEHLIIHHDDAEKFLPRIRNAGSVFLGSLTPESAGDYASGTNHVLPTYGAARATSGLNVLSFMKSMTAQKISRVGIRNLGETVIRMAEAEGLHAHARAMKIRVESAS